MAIHKMTTINKITAKIDHVLFTCNCCFGLRKRAHMCMLLQKSCLENFSKFQRLRWSLFSEKDHFYNWWMSFEKELSHNWCVYCCVWGNGMIRVQKIITTIYKKNSRNKHYSQIITRFLYKPPRRNTRPSDITASSQLKVNLVASILSLIYMS